MHAELHVHQSPSKLVFTTRERERESGRAQVEASQARQTRRNTTIVIKSVTKDSERELEEERSQQVEDGNPIQIWFLEMSFPRIFPIHVIKVERNCDS